jgi:putative nucleotidyltransferase with HDIG domain
MSELDDLAKRVSELDALSIECSKYQKALESLVELRNEQLQIATANLERSYSIAAEALVGALDLKSAGAERHAKRVTAFTMAIARCMRLPNDRINTIAYGAFLHDIGKIATPGAILATPAKLNTEETMIMREHPGHGYQIVKRIPFLSEAAETVHAHHERFDGSGYPRGLEGEEIPLGARIVAVANTLDSITSNLPYRPAQSVSAARNEIQHGAGHQFDPEIVEAFLWLPESLWNGPRKI